MVRASWRRVLSAILVVCACVALASCALLIAKGRCEVTNWQQDYYQYLKDYGYVHVFYKVTNTGALDIDYYEVWFEVQCADGSTYQDWTNGLNVRAGGYVTASTLIGTAGKQATSVKITSFEVKSY